MFIIQVNSSKSRFAKKYLSVFSERFVVSKCDTNLSEKTLAKVCAYLQFFLCLAIWLATVYKGNIIKDLIMDCQSYTRYRPNETTGGIFVSWRRKEELPTGA